MKNSFTESIRYNILTPRTLNKLSYQNHLAAIQIQKRWKGYRKRIELWSYGGILYVNIVIKVQRCWRGLLV